MMLLSALLAALMAGAADANRHFIAGDLSDAMGTGAREEALVSITDPDGFFEPQVDGFHVQEVPDELQKEAGSDGFGVRYDISDRVASENTQTEQAYSLEFFDDMDRYAPSEEDSRDCGEHGCAHEITVVTVTSEDGKRSETTDGTTSLTRAPSSSGALWTLQQAPNSCSLSWFNSSWPLVSSYEVHKSYGVESCINSEGTLWFGMFQLEDSEAVDVLFEHICSGSLDLRWTLLGDHVEQIAPSTSLNSDYPLHPRLTEPNLDLGPTSTASPTVAGRKRLEASGTVFMVVRNGCSGPTTVQVRQSLMARVELSLHNTFEILDAVIVGLVIGASAMFVYSAMLLCQAMKVLDDIEDVEQTDRVSVIAISKTKSVPSKSEGIARSNSAEDPSTPLLKAAS